MDQTLVNWLFAGFGSAAGWIVKMLWDAVVDLRKAVAQIERAMPETYVRRDDFKDAVKEMREDMRVGFKHVDHRLDVLFERLGEKEDRA
tara:strand:+ start:200 stop:466 length:267 start_codon:yes stop_codon:yes gene_type:complete